MTKTFTAAFAQTPKTNSVMLTAAVALTGANSLADPASAVNNTSLLYTAPAEGAIVTDLRFVPRATTTLMGGMFFIRHSAKPSTERHYQGCVVIPANTVSVSSPPVSYVISNISETTPLRLGAGDEVHVGLTVANTGGITAAIQATEF